MYVCIGACVKCNVLIQFTIDVGHEAVFEVNITKPDIKGRHEGEILIKTSLGKVR